MVRSSLGLGLRAVGEGLAGPAAGAGVAHEGLQLALAAEDVERGGVAAGEARLDARAAPADRVLDLAGLLGREARLEALHDQLEIARRHVLQMLARALSL